MKTQDDIDKKWAYADDFQKGLEERERELRNLVKEYKKKAESVKTYKDKPIEDMTHLEMNAEFTRLQIRIRQLTLKLSLMSKKEFLDSTDVGKYKDNKPQQP